MIQLKGIAWDHPRGFDPMVETAKLFQKTNPEIEIKWDKRPLQAFADRPIEEMAFDYDLMVIDHPHVGEASRKNLIYELNLNKKYENELLLLEKNSVGLSHQSYNFNGNQYALAIDAAAPVSAFRDDLIDNPPITFDETIKLAEKSKVIWPIKPVDSISCFNSIAANFDNPINVVPEKFIDHSLAIEILKMMKKLSKLVPKDCLSMNPINVLDIMSDTDDFYFCPQLYGYSNYSRVGFRKSIINFGNMISFNDDKNNSKGSQLGGTGLAISKSTNNLDIALEYSFWVASETCQIDTFYKSGGQPGHLKAWQNEVVNNDCKNFFINTLDTLQKSWLRPRYDGYMYFQDKAGTLINNFLKEEIALELTLDGLLTEFERSFSVNK